MRPCSLICLYQGLRSLPANTLPAFEAQLSERREVLRQIKPHEAGSLVALVEALIADGGCDEDALAGFVFSFSIPQIGKEFDLVKVTDDAVVNIELKSEVVPREKVVAQLIKNHHYLKSLGRAVHAFTYVTGETTLFELGEANELLEVDIARLAHVLSGVGAPFEGEVEGLFHPRAYLVSPTADTERFLAREYFLTNQQEEIKRAVTRAIDEGGLPCSFVVSGSAGTGKSLLAYDLALGLGAGRDACVVLCGPLTEGHRTLGRHQGHFAIVRVDELLALGACPYRLVFVDEAERLEVAELDALASMVASSGGLLYLSVDEYYTNPGVRSAYEALVDAFGERCQARRLTGRIRTNRELSGFIRLLFGLTEGVASVRTSHVKVSFACDAAGARELLGAYRAMGYQTPAIGVPAEVAQSPAPRVALAPDAPNAPNASHAPLGAWELGECDRVAVVMGTGIEPAEGGGLRVRGAADGGERHLQELYQAMTRAREDIALVVLGDEALVEHLLTLLGMAPARASA